MVGGAAGVHEAVLEAVVEAVKGELQHVMGVEMRTRCESARLRRATLLPLQTQRANHIASSGQEPRPIRVKAREVERACSAACCART
jgi:hypothetical protein